MIRYNKLLVAAGAAALTAGLYTTAASAVSINADADARVIAALILNQTNGINFGDVVAGTAISTIQLDTAGIPNVTSGDAELAGGTVLAGAYTLSGEPLKLYSITLPGPLSPATLTSAGGDTMTVSAFNHNAGAAPALDGVGAGGFNVGATLNMSANQPGGSYSGTWPLIVNYQ
jgi:hypothetical protein